MATHYRHPIDTRRWRALETILELLTTWVELWAEFWYGTAPATAAHESSDHGATPRWADTLHDLDITAVHDTLSSDVGRYEQLMHAQVISGDPELTDLHVVSHDGGRITGTLYGEISDTFFDKLPGA